MERWRGQGGGGRMGGVAGGEGGRGGGVAPSPIAEAMRASMCRANVSRPAVRHVSALERGKSVLTAARGGKCFATPSSTSSSCISCCSSRSCAVSGASAAQEAKRRTCCRSSGRVVDSSGSLCARLARYCDESRRRWGERTPASARKRRSMVLHSGGWRLRGQIDCYFTAYYVVCA
jgi:hypothetical protein